MKDSRSKSEKLLDAMGLIDDEFLSEAYETDSAEKLKEIQRNEKKILFSLRTLRNIASLAACITIIISAFYLIPWINTRNLGIGSESSDAQEGQIPGDPPAEETNQAAVSSQAPVISSVAEVASRPENIYPAPIDKDLQENAGEHENLEASREEESSEESPPEELCEDASLPNDDDLLKYAIIIPRSCCFSDPVT